MVSYPQYGTPRESSTNLKSAKSSLSRMNGDQTDFYTGRQYDAEADEWLMSCRCESAKSISTLLSCLQHISFGSGIAETFGREISMTQSRKRSAPISQSLHPVTVFCSDDSITFHVIGKAKQFQASVDIRAEIFSDYRVAKQQDEDNREIVRSVASFCVNLSTVLDSLHVLGTQNLDKTKLCLSYNLTQEVFKIELLEESGVLSTALIPGMEPRADDMYDSLASSFRISPISARFILKSEVLLEIINELDLIAGATTVTVSLGPSGIDIAAIGFIGECLISVPSHCSHVISFEITNADREVHDYTIRSLLGSMQGLELADETCITMNKHGMLAIQHRVFDQSGDSAPSFVDFILCCLEGNNEEEDEETAITATQGTTDSGWARSPSTLQNYSSLYGDDEGAEENVLETSSTPSLAAPLFGSVVRDAFVKSPNDNRSVRRRINRDKSNDIKFKLSNDKEDEDEFVNEPLDVTARSSPVHNAQRDGYCSSPELVYGPQY